MKSSFFSTAAWPSHSEPNRSPDRHWRPMGESLIADSLPVSTETFLQFLPCCPCSVSAADRQDFPGVSWAFPAASVSCRHRCTHAAVPWCCAAAWSAGARASLQFLVHRPTSRVFCSVCQCVEVWRECTFHGGKLQNCHLISFCFYFCTICA